MSRALYRIRRRVLMSLMNLTDKVDLLNIEEFRDLP